MFVGTARGNFGALCQSCTDITGALIFSLRLPSLSQGDSAELLQKVASSCGIKKEDLMFLNLQKQGFELSWEQNAVGAMVFYIYSIFI